MRRRLHPLKLRDRYVPLLTRTADSGLLWYGAAALLGIAGGRTARRAALRGAGSFALASVITRTVAKPYARNERPVLDAAAVLRRFVGRPQYTPPTLGPAASAAAFAVGVALESPRYGVVVAPLAAAVAASRLRSGLRGSGEVLAGVAIGACAAALTSRWWPVIPDSPAVAVRPRLPAPPLPGGVGLSLVVNPGSGITGAGSSHATVERLRALLPDARITELGPEDDLPALLEQAASETAGQGGALGVCGGDGTVNAAAEAAVRHGVPLAVFPGGTFNHFAADLGIESMQDVVRAVTGGDAVTVDLGRASSPDGEEQVFLNTFSLGVYPELVHAREKLEASIGKWPALAVGLARVLASSRPITVAVNGRPRRLWLLFAGNGVYQPSGFAPTYRTRLDDGLLDIRAVDGNTPWARTRLLLAVLTGTLHHSRVLVTAQLRTLRVDALEGDPHFAYDGEVARVSEGSLVLGKTTRALTVYRPAGGEDPWLG
ncbi:phosphoesterase [Streptomyces sp. A3M-1-3]|uniref:diacylglycerol/lipid kinase family protein n=1 Tax=Streptomyces sp. A3M-1-3 TaxID=2962044 RepID=UPI0020B652BD|nr:diacylglycerol kinase family protein [Streptomyces sp. A3M-1-3]MCP3822237.1 phosphoesterase [Streptomyces sp. A3M-1-3]